MPSTRSFSASGRSSTSSLTFCQSVVSCFTCASSASSSRAVVVSSSISAAAWLVHTHLSHTPKGAALASVFLVVYLALNLPAIGQRIVLLTRQLVRLRNYAFALLEPIVEPTERRASAELPAVSPSAASAVPTGVAIELDGVTALAGGQPLLE